MYCNHNYGGPGCVPCAIEKQTKKIVSAIDRLEMRKEDQKKVRKENPFKFFLNYFFGKSV